MSLVYLRRTDRFTPSKGPYWFDVSTHDGDTIGALWVGRKAGRTTITQGTYRLWLSPADAAIAPVEPSLAWLIEHADTRYGGDWHYQWDGQRLLVSPRAPYLNPQQAQAMQDDLDELLSDLPNSLNTRQALMGPYVRTAEMERA